MPVSSPPAVAPLTALRTPSGQGALSGIDRLRRLLALERADVLSLIWFSAAIGLLSLAVPIATQALVNTVAFTALGQPILVLAVLVMVGLSLAALLRVWRYQTVERLQQRIFVKAAYDAVVRLTRAKLAAFGDHGAPELMNRFFEVVTIQKATAKLLVDGLSVALQSAVSLLLLAFYHPALLAFDVLLVTSIGLVLWLPARTGMKSAVVESKRKYAVAAWLEEVAAGARAFKAVRADGMAFDRVDTLAVEYVQARKQHSRTVLRQTIGSYIIQILAVSGLLGLGGWLVMRGELTLGQLVAAELIVAGVTTGLTKLGQYLESFYDLVASVDKLGSIIDLEEESSSGRLVPDNAQTGAHVKVDNVSYAYPGGGAALDRVSLELRACEHVAIVGQDSSGKSTLAEMLFALRTPDTGSIRIDGVELRDYAPTALRGAVALVGPRQIFDASVLDNVLLGATDHTADVPAVLRAVALDQDIATLPHGVATKVGHAGSRLTSSQAARLMLARALVRRPRLLILDETLDGLGSSTVQQVMQGVREYSPQTSLLVLTSRDDLAHNVGRTLHLSEGRLVEEAPQ